MSILTNDEINELSHPAARGKSVNACIMAAEKLIFEKLAGMELPEPAFTLNWRDGAYKVTKPNIDSQDCYTATQLHQAFVQGAASQLSAEPFAHYRHYDEQVQPFADDGTIPLYALKEPK